MEQIIKILAVYSTLHIGYTDMGMEVGKKYKKLVGHPYIVIPLMLAVTLDAFDNQWKPAALTVSIFYILMMWGNGKLEIPLLDSLVATDEYL